MASENRRARMAFIRSVRSEIQAVTSDSAGACCGDPRDLFQVGHILATASTVV